MNIMENWMKAMDYRITEGSEYTWECYPNAYCLDSWNGEQDGHSFTIIFSTADQTVYELQAHDYANNRAYRWVNPDYKQANAERCLNMGVSADNAWDDLRYVDLELTDDYFEKVSGIKSGNQYDTRVSVPVDLPDDELFRLMMMAHEKDITLNQLIEDIITEQIKRLKEAA